MRSMTTPTLGGVLTRGEYLAWAKHRALQHLSHGNPSRAVDSLVGDLEHHHLFVADNALQFVLLHGKYALKGGERAVKRWIESFS